MVLVELEAFLGGKLLARTRRGLGDTEGRWLRFECVGEFELERNHLILVATSLDMECSHPWGIVSNVVDASCNTALGSPSRRF